MVIPTAQMGSVDCWMPANVQAAVLQSHNGQQHLGAKRLKDKPMSTPALSPYGFALSRLSRQYAPVAPLRFLLAFALLVGSAFAQLERMPTFIVTGILEPSVFPLLNEAGEPIQWNAPTFEGFVYQGKTKKPICGAAARCYSYNGNGNWQFNLAGKAFCANTCVYTATGDLIVGDPIALPDGSYIQYLSAVLTGTFTDERGNTHSDVMGYYSTYTAPTLPGFGGIPVPAQGGITIVLHDN
jgi:hypothetical protein